MCSIELEANLHDNVRQWLVVLISCKYKTSCHNVISPKLFRTLFLGHFVTTFKNGLEFIDVVL